MISIHITRAGRWARSFQTAAVRLKMASVDERTPRGGPAAPAAEEVESAENTNLNTAANGDGDVVDDPGSAGGEVASGVEGLCNVLCSSKACVVPTVLASIHCVECAFGLGTLAS